MIPVADSGEDEMIQDRASPEGSGLLDPALRERIGEPPQVGLQSSPLQRERIVALEEIFAYGIS